MKVGLTLPSFVDDPEIPLRVARAAESSGADGVFVFDHLFRVGAEGELRPALECSALLGAVAVETASVAIGTLVARATLRPPATLAVALDTVRRIAGARLIVGVGAGDHESRPEMQTFGLPFGSETDRLMALRGCLRVVRDRGYPIWVGGRARHVGLIAAEGADGWNRWGVGVERFAAERAEVQRLAERLARSPSLFNPTWGGLVLLGRDEADAEAKRARLTPGPGVLVGGPERVAEQLRAYGDAGARWVILGPVDSRDPDNAAIVGELLRPLLD
jgi:alkanesulfonate monooxygenase SsuD/methylene tetrahydromethanopterin reductase-like flavin-dependent oxidoreductase (luciferase family)